MLLALAGVGALTAAWALFWPVPTEVVGRGVVIVPGGASVIDARAEGQILELPVAVGDTVRRQEKNLNELIRIEADFY